MLKRVSYLKRLLIVYGGIITGVFLAFLAVYCTSQIKNTRQMTDNAMEQLASKAVSQFESILDESAVFNKSSHILSVNHPTNASYARLWRTNELAFSGESLEEIVVLLNRMYNVEVRFLSNKIKGYSFSGVIRNNSLDNVFEIISLTAPITYVSVGDTIYLNEK